MVKKREGKKDVTPRKQVTAPIDMVDWTSPAELAREALAFDRFMHTLLGVYAWEWVISLDFDWQFIRGRKRFRWPLTFYFLNRYFMLFSLIGIIVGLDVTSEINCQALYSFNTVIGACAIGLASINLSLRTIAVWSWPWYIVAPLVAIILGHFSLLLQVVTLKATWITEKGCVITYTNNAVLAPTFIYTMIFDLIILVLTAVKLFDTGSGSRSSLGMLIFKDGLIYFIIAFLANVLATTFILLNLNPLMSVIANIPAAIVSSIAACRVVRRLNDYSSGPQVFSMTNSFFSSGEHPNFSTLLPKEGIHVQMETFPGSALETKANQRNGIYDPESPNHGEFKWLAYDRLDCRRNPLAAVGVSLYVILALATVLSSALNAE